MLELEELNKKDDNLPKNKDVLYKVVKLLNKESKYNELYGNKTKIQKK